MERQLVYFDKYTKIVLSVIAVCLIFLCAKPYINPNEIQAQGIQFVRVMGTVDVNIKEIDGNSFGITQVSTLGPALPVTVSE